MPRSFGRHRPRRLVRGAFDLWQQSYICHGPRCSGLPIVRYNAGILGTTLGTDFGLMDSRRHDRTTPRGAVQRFQFQDLSSGIASRCGATQGSGGSDLSKMSSTGHAENASPLHAALRRREGICSLISQGARFLSPTRTTQGCTATTVRRREGPT
jgi:hypothetical protein